MNNTLRSNARHDYGGRYCYQTLIYLPLFPLLWYLQLITRNNFKLNCGMPEALRYFAIKVLIMRILIKQDGISLFHSLF